MCRIRVTTGSSWAIQETWDFGNHIIGKKLLNLFIETNYISTISKLLMVLKFSNLFNSSIWTGRYSNPTHHRRPNLTCGRGLNLEYYATKVYAFLTIRSQKVSGLKNSITLNKNLIFSLGCQVGQNWLLYSISTIYGLKS